MIDDSRNSLEKLKSKLAESEEIDMASVKVGDIIYVSLDTDDVLILNKGYSSRNKYIVIIGFTSEGIAVGALLINSEIDLSKRSAEMMDCQYPLLARHYPDILKYDSWLDCSDIFHLSKDKISERKGILKGRLIHEDRERVIEFLRESDMFDNVTKRKFGLL